MLEALITSKTRIKLLVRFFLNPGSSAYLRSLEKEFGESTNAIRIELNRFEKAGLLYSSIEGNKKLFRVNTGHPLFEDIQQIVLKHFRIDKVIDGIIDKLGSLKYIFLTGDFARGNDSDIIDLVFVGNGINKSYLMHLVDKAENVIERKVRYIIYTIHEFENSCSEKNENNMLLLWQKEEDI